MTGQILDSVEEKFLQELKKNRSKLQNLTMRPIEFLEENPDKIFDDPDYFKEHQALVEEGDLLLDKLNEHRRKKFAQQT